MIISVEELRQHVTTDKTDSELEMMLQALEQAIRKYTNNNFQHTGYRREADIVGGCLIVESVNPFAVGDTVQISESQFSNGIYTVALSEDSVLALNESVPDEDRVLLTKVVYPADVKMGAVNMLKWDLENRGKVGIQSETISRHSVTYFNMDGANSVIGYPKSLLGFLKPYRKARF